MSTTEYKSKFTGQEIDRRLEQVAINNNNITDVTSHLTELSTEVNELNERLNKKLYAYPVDTLDGKENKVVGLGGDSQYIYVGELIASEFGTPSFTEEKVLSDVMHTGYLYQPIYDGKYVEYFEEYMPEYITLYIGNDVDGYSSNKVYISEDANNLTYYPFNFVGGFGPRMLEVAISPDYILHCRNYWHYANKNSKVFFAIYKQQLDVNLIPQEIARKEDIPSEIIKSVKNYDNSKCIADFYNYVSENGNVQEGLHIQQGELGSKSLTITNYVDSVKVSFSYVKEDENDFYYSSDVADIRIHKTSEPLGPYNINVYPYYLTAYKYVCKVNYDDDNNTFDFPDEMRTECWNVLNSVNYYGIKFYLMYNGYTNIIDSPYYRHSKSPNSVCLKHKYIEYKLKIITTKDVVETTRFLKYTIEVTKEIDILSLESRLAALESK